MPTGSVGSCVGSDSTVKDETAPPTYAFDDGTPATPCRPYTDEEWSRLVTATVTPRCVAAAKATAAVAGARPWAIFVSGLPGGGKSSSLRAIFQTLMSEEKLEAADFVDIDFDALRNFHAQYVAAANRSHSVATGASGTAAITCNAAVAHTTSSDSTFSATTFTAAAPVSVHVVAPTPTPTATAPPAAAVGCTTATRWSYRDLVAWFMAGTNFEQVMFRDSSGERGLLPQHVLARRCHFTMESVLDSAASFGFVEFVRDVCGYNVVLAHVHTPLPQAIARAEARAYRTGRWSSREFIESRVAGLAEWLVPMAHYLVHEPALAMSKAEPLPPPPKAILKSCTPPPSSTDSGGAGTGKGQQSVMVVFDNSVDGASAPTLVFDSRHHCTVHSLPATSAAVKPPQQQLKLAEPAAALWKLYGLQTLVSAPIASRGAASVTDLFVWPIDLAHRSRRGRAAAITSFAQRLVSQVFVQPTTLAVASAANGTEATSSAARNITFLTTTAAASVAAQQPPCPPASEAVSFSLAGGWYKPLLTARGTTATATALPRDIDLFPHSEASRDALVAWLNTRCRAGTAVCLADATFNVKYRLTPPPPLPVFAAADHKTASTAKTPDHIHSGGDTDGLIVEVVKRCRPSLAATLAAFDMVASAVGVQFTATAQAAVNAGADRAGPWQWSVAVVETHVHRDWQRSVCGREVQLVLPFANPSFLLATAERAVRYARDLQWPLPTPALELLRARWTHETTASAAAGSTTTTATASTTGDIHPTNASAAATALSAPALAPSTRRDALLRNYIATTQDAAARAFVLSHFGIAADFEALTKAKAQAQAKA